MRSWTTFKKPISWNSLKEKPAILADNQISWEEIQNIPTPVQALLNMPSDTNLWAFVKSWDGIPQYFRVSGDGIPSSGSTNIVRRANGNIWARTYVATNIPTSPVGLTTGTFYIDNGFVKVA